MLHPCLHRLGLGLVHQLELKIAGLGKRPVAGICWWAQKTRDSLLFFDPRDLFRFRLLWVHTLAAVFEMAKELRD
jgi:hypothetical protein